MSDHDWLTTMLRAQREHALRDRSGHVARTMMSDGFLRVAKPAGGRTATMRRRAALLGVFASIAAVMAAPSAAVAQSALAEPWATPNGLHTDINGRLTNQPMRGAGGIGDGTSHPVGTVIGAKIAGYGSLSGAAQLAAIQAYPYVSCQYATATTDEMDLLAFRTLAAKAIANGGDIVRPEAGIWMMSGPLPDVPAAYDIGSFTRQATYSIQGAGSPFCIFKFMNDVSTGYGSAFALKVANRSNADGTNFLGLWSGFTFVGPGTSITYGSKNCQLSGIGWGARRRMSDIHVLGFYAGISLQGDQTEFDSILCSNCTFGMYWDIANGTLFGDYQINRAQIVQCSIACVACGPTAQIPKIVWIKPVFATSPVGVAKLVNTGIGGWSPNCLYENEMRGVQFEQMGYCPIAEIDATSLLPNPTAGSYNANIMVNCQLIRAEFGPFDTSRKFPSFNPSAGIAEGQNMLGTNTIELSIEGNLSPGSNGIFNVISFGSFTGFDRTVVKGDIDGVLGNIRAVTNTSGYPRSLIVGANSDPEHLIFVSSVWAGKMMYDGGALSPPINTYVLMNDVGNSFKAASGVAADAQCGGGVVKFRRTDGGSGENWLLLATRGYNTIATTNTWSGNQTVRTSTSGGPVAASGPADATSYNLGVSYGGTSGGLASVRLFEKFNWIDT